MRDARRLRFSFFSKDEPPGFASVEGLRLLDGL